ncbi:MAG: hypothetical protein PG981_000955 [Wolbachia endosymbiont of Ctenocephalides orientis wCori]|nr:MAG: hypothetical protein PG981_000955 [Wolbachia endosymbiont of Ctenocephalides orientis wCori]
MFNATTSKINSTSTTEPEKKNTAGMPLGSV